MQKKPAAAPPKAVTQAAPTPSAHGLTGHPRPIRPLTASSASTISALPRSTQRQRKRSTREDKKDELFPNRMNEINNIPIQASKSPSNIGFVFSDRKIAPTAVRQPYLEKAKSEMADMPGLADLRQRPLELGRQPHDEIGVSPESIAMRRLAYPEEFYHELKPAPYPVK